MRSMPFFFCSTKPSTKSKSNFDPLESREWQRKDDRITHGVCLDIFKSNMPSYPEAKERFRRAVEDAQISVEQTDLIYNSHKYPSSIKNRKFQESYREYELCLRRLNEEMMTFARSCDDYEDEHPELRRRRLKRQGAHIPDPAPRRCKVDITVGESSVDIKVKGDADVRVKQKRTVPPPPYNP
ncbi:hypothetical protein BT96DRAFT_1018602 [Gymnopus androsaceus JB14]|uniref:Uncharacterized protein n=1 Tax=Gymnopus androsaceus JB14 TaxID=1447944 RepID=A0A6A4HSP4_9AGAR|nr:hypothetical protein BT96DRAFT_1018602 [Gymnopus androsaceus JB14]